jgi:hypothetical protein
MLLRNCVLHGANRAPARAYNVDTDVGTVQANYAGQPNNRTSYQGPPGLAMQPTGYRIILFMTTPELEHMKTHHAELHNRLRNIRVDVAAALVPIRGPLPPGITKMLAELQLPGKRSPAPTPQATSTPFRIPVNRRNILYANHGPTLSTATSRR